MLATLANQLNSRVRAAAFAFAASALLAGFASTSAFASSGEQGTLKAEFSQSHPDTIMLHWTGTVAAPMAQQIKDAFEQRKGQAQRVILTLASGGGSVREGERVIQVLREIKKTHRLETVVAHGRTCGSMCVFIYVQGEKRVAALTSSWLFHEAAKNEGDRTVSLDRALWERLVDDYFIPAGVSPQWIAKIKPLTIRTDYWQTGADLFNGGSGIVHEALGNQNGRIVHDGKPAGPPAQRIAARGDEPRPEQGRRRSEPETPAQPAPQRTEAPAPAPAEGKECKFQLPGLGVYVNLPCGALAMN